MFYKAFGMVLNCEFALSIKERVYVSILFGIWEFCKNDNNSLTQ